MALVQPDALVVAEGVPVGYGGRVAPSPSSAGLRFNVPANSQFLAVLIAALLDI
jgi:hypothetical protein